jgi:hypothetical protein
MQDSLHDWKSRFDAAKENKTVLYSLGCNLHEEYISVLTRSSEQAKRMTAKDNQILVMAENVDRIQKDNESMLEENAKLKKQLEDMGAKDNKISELEAKLVRSKTRCEEINKKHAIAESALNDQRHSDNKLNQKVLRLTAEVQSKADEISRLGDVVEENAALKTKLEQAIRETKQSESEYGYSMGMMVKQRGIIEKADAENANLRDQIQVRDEKITELTRQLGVQTGINTSFSASLELLQQNAVKCDELNKELEIRTKMFDVLLKKTNSNAAKGLFSFTKSNQDALEINASLVRENAEARIRIKELEELEMRLYKTATTEEFVSRGQQTEPMTLCETAPHAEPKVVTMEPKAVATTPACLGSTASSVERHSETDAASIAELMLEAKELAINFVHVESSPVAMSRPVGSPSFASPAKTYAMGNVIQKNLDSGVGSGGSGHSSVEISPQGSMYPMRTDVAQAEPLGYTPRSHTSLSSSAASFDPETMVGAELVDKPCMAQTPICTEPSVKSTSIDKDGYTKEWVSGARALGTEISSIAAWSTTEPPVSKIPSAEDIAMDLLINHEPLAVQVFFTGKITGTFDAVLFRDALTTKDNADKQIEVLERCFNAKSKKFSDFAIAYLYAPTTDTTFVDDVYGFLG